MSLTEMSAPRKTKTIDIQGVPVYGGAVLTPADPVFERLNTIEDYCAFAKQIRGTFAIIVREDQAITAITDFGACASIYYLRDAAGTFRVTFSLGELRPYSSGQIAPHALFFYAGLNGIGLDPLYADARMVYPATVARFAAGEVTTTTYLDWDECLTEQPMTREAAYARFMEIASEYLAAVARKYTVGCLLSGGTDSAIIAYLLKQVCPDVLCLTADYPIKRYSEYANASLIARRLNLRHERVLVRRADSREAMLAMNTRQDNFPAHHSHLVPIYALLREARQQNVCCLFHGHNSGAIFMEFTSFFDGFPPTTAGYLEAAARLSRADKLHRLIPDPVWNGQSDEFLRAFGCAPEDYQQWRRQLVEKDRRHLSRWVDRFPYPAVSQLHDQLAAGVALVNGWFPAQRLAGAGMQLMGPFLDYPMVRFGLSMPFSLKFRDGLTKAFLYDFLEAKTGLRLPKRASPNLARVWNLSPHLSDLGRMDKRVRPLLGRYLLRNAASAGRFYVTVGKLRALGLWLRSHELGDVAALPDPAITPEMMSTVG
jgi:asparagine synthetase B (glutamine-hydrolysing)